MGTYLNPGTMAFQMGLNSEIFIDKTEMIGFLNGIINTEHRYVCISRPRRFGKTMAADMLCAYYDRTANSKEMFEQLKIASLHDWDKYLMNFDVIRLVMTRFFKKNITVADGLTKMQRSIIREIKKTYPDVDYFDDSDLLQTIDDVYSDKQLVVVIDEWDAVFRERQADKDGQTQYLNFLRDLLKDNAHVALAYMTGILPIKKYGKHSALNMFNEYSMLAPLQLAEYTGFTEEEVRGLCDRYAMTYEEISNWYDGYLLSSDIPIKDREAYRQGEYTGNKISIYSPLSVVKAVTTGHIANYWNKTETYEALAEYIRKDYDGLKDSVALLMNGGRLAIDTSSYQNDMTTFNGKDDILSLLIHLGYLGYDDGEVFIPNKEILDEFKTSTKTSEWTEVFRRFNESREILKAVWAVDEEKVASLLEKAHNRAENKTYNNEAALSYAIQIALYAACEFYTTILELDSGKGYADIVYLPAPKYQDKPVLLIELKYDKDVDTALDQIKNQQYPDGLEHYKGNILLVGINYDKDGLKHHTCKIERA